MTRKKFRRIATPVSFFAIILYPINPTNAEKNVAIAAPVGPSKPKEVSSPSFGINR